MSKSGRLQPVRAETQEREEGRGAPSTIPNLLFSSSEVPGFVADALFIQILNVISKVFLSWV